MTAARSAGGFTAAAAADALLSVLTAVPLLWWAAWLAGVRSVEGVVRAPIDPPADIVVTTAAGYPLDLTYYQAVKGMVGALPAVKRGGTILLAARCAGGIGSRDFRDSLLNTPDLEAFVARTYEPGFFIPDQWEVHELAKALRHALAVVVPDLDEAVRVANEYAPEHLILQVDQARSLAAGVRSAGSVFLGAWTPESVGDYCSGTNHVLPTYGFARAYSGLSVTDFQRRMTLQELTRAGLEGLAPTVLSLARLEGLEAHASAVAIRLEVPAARAVN